jgi:ABC-2 type transport system ATP-binding protein
MTKQAVFSIFLAAKPKYLLLDEPIDGIDPIARKILYKEIFEHIAENKMSVLISSHNLKELEGLCDCIIILEDGKVNIEKKEDGTPTSKIKVQAAFKKIPDFSKEKKIKFYGTEQRGKVFVFVMDNNEKDIEYFMDKYNPLLFEILPLSLEEVFIYELSKNNEELMEVLK